MKAPKPRDLGLHDREVYVLMQALLLRQQQQQHGEDMNIQLQQPIPEINENVFKWPLHLKHTTPLNTEAVRQMPTAHEHTKRFLVEAYRYIKIATTPRDDPYPIPHLVQTTHTIKTTRMTEEDIRQAV